MEHDIEWKSILHHSLAEVARREHPCDNPSGHGKTTDMNCKGTAILRQSVPLLLQLEEITNGEVNTQYSNLNHTYSLALDAFGTSASLLKTMEFIQSHLLQPPSDKELSFYYPRYSQEDVILCPDKMKALSEDTFSQLLQSVGEFSRHNFLEALKDMNLWGKERRDKNRQQQLSDLKMVGQGGG
jgi:hypothetical protein